MLMMSTIPLKSVRGIVTFVLLNTYLLFLNGCASTPSSTSQGEYASAHSLESSYPLDKRLVKANTLYEKGDLPEAEKLYLNIIYEYEEVNDAWFKLGNIYYRTGRYDAAVSAYEKVLKSDVKYEQAWVNLSLCRVKQALETIDMALVYIEPNSVYKDKISSIKERLSSKANTKNHVQPAIDK